MSNVVLFTYRSGSTVLADLLAFKQGTINLGEALHSAVRNYNYNTEQHRQTTLYKSCLESLTGKYHTPQTRGSDFIGFHKAKEKRIELIKQYPGNWTVKDNLDKLSFSSKFIDYCIDNNINVYMTHRSDIIKQFVSKINARYRAEIAKDPTQFIFTNDAEYNPYDQMVISFAWLRLYMQVFLDQLLVWRTVYERYKPYIKLVSYEKHIQPMQLDEFGITQDDVKQYKNLSTHLVPTPINATRVIVTDDHPAPMVGAWEQTLYHINHHKYLVEI